MDDLLATLMAAVPGDTEDLFTRPAWHTLAACRGKGTAAWFPERGQDTEPARAVCRGCRVRVDCATFALGYSTRDLTGVWGGLPGSVRRDARRYGWTAEEAIELADLRDRLDRLAG